MTLPTAVHKSVSLSTSFPALGIGSFFSHSSLCDNFSQLISKVNTSSEMLIPTVCVTVSCRFPFGGPNSPPPLPLHWDLGFF